MREVEAAGIAPAAPKETRIAEDRQIRHETTAHANVQAPPQLWYWPIRQPERRAWRRSRVWSGSYNVAGPATASRSHQVIRRPVVRRLAFASDSASAAPERHEATAASVTS